MADVSIGRLFLRMGIDDKDLKQGRARTEKELKSLEKRTQQFQANITRTLGRVAPWLTISAAVLGIGRAFVSMGQDARALEDLRLSSGLTVRSLYELREMVNQTGGSVQDLTTAVTAFDRAILTASRDSRSEAAQAFRILGINVRDAQGNLVTLDQVTNQLAAKWPTYTDGVNKAALAQTVFGGAATAMTRALNQGEEGVRRAKEEVDKYGRSAADVHREQLEWINKTNELSTALTNLRDRAITPMIPSLIRLVDWFSKLSDRVGRIGETFKLMRLDYLDQQVRDAGAEVERLEKKVGGLEQEFVELAQRSPEATARLELLRNEIIRGNQELGAAIRNYRAARGEVEAFEKAVESAKSGGGGGETTTAPATTQPGRTQSGLSPDQQRALKGMLDQVSLLNQQLNGLPTKIGLIGEINTNTYDAMQAKVTETIDIINAKYKEQEDTVRNLHQLKMQLAREEQDTAMQTADMVGSAISSMFSKSKAAAMAETIIHTATAVMRALRDVPWPYNLVQAAAIAAQGAAQLAKIRSTTEKGGGGSAGGISASAPQSAPTQHALHVQGVDRASLYTGAVVENIIEAINEKVQQGVTLISTRNVPV